MPEIRPATVADALAIANMYNHYVINTTITFEFDPVSESDMAARIGDTLAVGLPWLVTVEDGTVVGYAYASKWKGRCAYRHTVEASVYLKHECTGKGLGTALYKALFTRLRELNMHAVIGGIALPNPPSERLHERMGMRQVAHFQEVGHKFERWIDVGYWQCLL